MNSTRRLAKTGKPLLWINPAPLNVGIAVGSECKRLEKKGLKGRWWICQSRVYSHEGDTLLFLASVSRLRFVIEFRGVGAPGNMTKPSKSSVVSVVLSTSQNPV